MQVVQGPPKMLLLIPVSPITSPDKILRIFCQRRKLFASVIMDDDHHLAQQQHLHGNEAQESTQASLLSLCTAKRVQAHLTQDGTPNAAEN